MKQFKITGFSLVEVMVSMTVGLVILGAAGKMYEVSTDQSKFNREALELQEMGAHILDRIGTDIALAGHYSYGVPPGNALVKKSFLAANNVTDAMDPHPCSQNPTVVDGTDFFSTRRASMEVLDYSIGVTGDNFGNASLIAANTTSATIFQSRTYSDDAEFNENFYNETVAELQEDHGIDIATAEVRASMVTGWAVKRSDGATEDVPTLRSVVGSDSSEDVVYDEDAYDPAVSHLCTGAWWWGGVLQWYGVEDLQIQIGIDTNGDALVDRYIDADDPAYAGSRAITAKVWLRLRSIRGFPGYSDTKTYEYADRVFEADDNLLRTVMSRTIKFRNEVIL